MGNRLQKLSPNIFRVKFVSPLSLKWIVYLLFQFLFKSMVMNVGSPWARPRPKDGVHMTKTVQCTIAQNSAQQSRYLRRTLVRGIFGHQARL